jgi:AraC family transcriptional regulator
MIAPCRWWVAPSFVAGAINIRQAGEITFGRVLCAADVSGFILTETEHAPHFVLRRHVHACANLDFVLAGFVRETLDSQTADCGPLSIVVKPPGEAHANRYGPAGARCLVLEITSSRFEMLRPFTGFLDRSAFHQNRSLAGQFLRIYKEFHTSDHCGPLVVEGLILELLGLLGRDVPGTRTLAPPIWLNRVRERIHDQPHEPWTLSILATAVGLQPNYFARMFRMFYRCSVGEYVRRLRLELAARELSDAEKPMAQVAAESGFYDQSHFTHAFKRRFHMTPTAYRLAARTDCRSSVPHVRPR